MTPEQLAQLQEQLDLIESRILYVSGFLRMVHQLQAIHPRYMQECSDHMDELGEAMEALLQAKQTIGLHSNLKLS